MDPSALVAMMASAVAGLFGALMLTMRQQREDWKGLYTEERKEHNETRTKAAQDVRDNAETVRELTQVLKEIPRRREDWLDLLGLPRGERSK